MKNIINYCKLINNVDVRISPDIEFRVSTVDKFSSRLTFFLQPAPHRPLPSISQRDTYVRRSSASKTTAIIISGTGIHTHVRLIDVWLFCRVRTARRPVNLSQRCRRTHVVSRIRPLNEEKKKKKMPVSADDNHTSRLWTDSVFFPHS